ncbi:MAG TPA: hypothetical protein DEO38_02130 [Bacteroidales bacterium]|nr:hypothetical protein [Bacteroidales bacterium]
MLSQDEFDALRMTPSDIAGTARYTAMAGAFSAIGGDASAIKDNPAALGIYRRSEVTFTLGYNLKQTNTKSMGVSREDFQHRFNAQQAAFVINFGGKKNRTRGLITNSLSFTYDHIYDFRRSFTVGTATGQLGTAASLTRLAELQANTGGVNAKMLSSENDPFGNVNVGWLSVAAYQAYLLNAAQDADAPMYSLLGTDERVRHKHALSENGGINQYAFSWGGNVNNYLFFGVGIGIRTLRYRMSSTYAERFENEGNFQIDNVVETTGTGVNFSLGLMGAPTDWMRLAASIQSVTLYRLKDYNEAAVDYFINDDTKGNFVTPEGGGSDLAYRFRSPMKVTAGAAFLIKQKAIISLQYELDRYQGLKFRDKSDPEAFADANNGIKSTARNMHTLKIGAEYTPVEGIAIRLGYARQLPNTERNAQRLLRYNTVRLDSEYEICKSADYASAGFGVRGTWWLVDIAYQFKTYKSDFYSYAAGAYADNEQLLDDAYQPQAASIRNNRHSVLVTFGVRF